MTRARSSLAIASNSAISASSMARLSALRLRGVFRVRVTTPFKSSRVKSSDDAATEEEAVMGQSRLGGRADASRREALVTPTVNEARPPAISYAAGRDLD